MKYVNKILLVLLLLFTCEIVSAKQISIYLFHSSDCSHCKAEIKFLDEIKDNYDIKVYKYEVMYNDENRDLLADIRKLLANNDSRVPFTIIGTTVITGFSDFQKSQIEGAVQEYQTVPYCDKVGLYLGHTTDQSGCNEKGKIYVDVSADKWVNYEFEDEKLIITDTNRVMPSSKGTTLIFKRDGSDTGAKGNWVCESIDGDASKCDDESNILIVRKDGNYIISNEENTIKPIPIIGEVDVKKFSLPLISIVMGFVDGFNPCAMWVLLFLLSMFVTMKNRKKAWFLGITFIATSAAVYFLIMIAWLNIVASLTTVRWIQIAIALFALGASVINIRSYIKSRKEDDGCNVTDAASRKKIVGKVKKIANLEEESENKKKFAFLLAVLGVMALAISVNVIELACSAGLPLVFTEILALNNLGNAAKLMYILIYILFFMIDDIIIFAIAMLTFKVTGISTKYTKYSHLIGGIIMLIIGLLLILRPSWIMFNF
ncbi:MAG: hypothetical protein J6Y42_01490 [Bacilli bacterium]|nr:hypothetical protein [Bacilli bacterium]